MQEIIVAIIGIFVVIFLGWKIYKLFTRKSSGSCHCAGCSMDCAIKDQNPEHCENDKNLLKDKIKK